MAALIWASVLPRATAFSIKASEIAELEPSLEISSVKGIPSLEAISLTFSWDAFCSSVLVETTAIAAAGAGLALAATGAVVFLALAITEAIN